MRMRCSQDDPRRSDRPDRVPGDRVRLHLGAEISYLPTLTLSACRWSATLKDRWVAGRVSIIKGLAFIVVRRTHRASRQNRPFSNVAGCGSVPCLTSIPPLRFRSRALAQRLRALCIGCWLLASRFRQQRTAAQDHGCEIINYDPCRRHFDETAESYSIDLPEDDTCPGSQGPRIEYLYRRKTAEEDAGDAQRCCFGSISDATDARPCQWSAAAKERARAARQTVSMTSHR